MIYVDDMRRPARVGSIRGRWSHLMTDSADQTALHQFAKDIGLKRKWFQEFPEAPWRNHYDVTDTVRRKALDVGAIETTYWGGTANVLDRAKAAHEAARAPEGTSSQLHVTEEARS